MKLSKTEEEVMQHIWKLDKAFMKDIIKEYGVPKPAATTIATLLKRMRDKGFIDYNSVGKSREYFPLVAKSDYFSKHFRGLINNFFGNSASTFASFFTKATDLSTEELEALRKVIDQEIKKKKKKQ
ncbi:MAG: BlaI family penicillinase repressor [Polaribacter sp.]|jgi:BlaI family penicillinase repressor